MATQILVADDNEDLRRMVVDILAEEGYQVTQVRNGREVLKVITMAGPYDLLITDISMPDMDGLELIQVCENLIRISRSWQSPAVSMVNSCLWLSGSELKTLFKSRSSAPTSSNSWNQLCRRPCYQL